MSGLPPREDQIEDAQFLGSLVDDYFQIEEDRPPWKWIEEHCELPADSAFPGESFDSEIVPFTRPVSEDVANDDVSTITILCSAQSAKTQTLIFLVLWIAVNDPGSLFWVMAAADDAKEFSKTRLKTAIEDCPATSHLVPTAQDKQGTILLQLLTMNIRLRGSNSKSKLQSTPVRWVILDELRNYAVGAYELVKKRVRSFWNSRVVQISTADSVDDIMHVEFKNGSQTHFHFDCPSCSHSQPFRFGRKASPLYPDERQRGGLIWETDEKTKPGGVWDWEEVAKTVRFECEECGHEIREEDRPDLVPSIRPVDYNAKPEPGARSYHWNALIVLWVPWKDIAIEFLKAIDAMKRGDIEPLKAFITETLGEPFELTGERPIDSEILARHRGRVFGEPYVRGEKWIPGKEKIVDLMTVDVQGSKGGHLKWVYRQWRQTGDSRLVDYGIALDFEELRELQRKHGIGLVFIDSAYRTAEVYTACLRYGWTAVRGSDQAVFYHRTKKGETFRRTWKVGLVDPNLGKTGQGQFAIQLLTWSNPSYKDRLGLVILPGGPNCPIWMIPEDTGQDYLDELTNNERRQKRRDSTGAVSFYWHKIGVDDWHDCENMQFAVMDAGGTVWDVDRTPPSEEEEKDAAA